MDYRQSLDYLYGLQRFGIKLGLENVLALLEGLGRPEQAYGIVHVAGTNGKGSVSAGLAEILRQAGCRVGLYTSPHLHSFTERIRVNGRAIEEGEVATLTEEIRSLAGGVPATFFEFTTALALLHFKRQEVDFVVLEVGMGGRLDATNAVTPLLSVITSICLDHGEYLGGSLAEVAAEKAGIIKRGVPVIVGAQEEQALEVLSERAGALSAPLYILGRDFVPQAEGERFSYRGLDLRLEGLRPALAGRHQHDNFSCALCAAELLRRQGLDLPEEALRLGVERVRWPGRLEWWKGERTVLLDGTHNGGGARVLADYLETLEVSAIRWVVGLKGDKSAEEILGPLLPLVSALYCTAPPVEEAASPRALAEAGRSAGLPALTFDTPALALEAALGDLMPGEIVLVAGSLFLVASAREHLGGASS